MKKILLTGSSGFIGKNLENVLSKNYEVISFDRQEGKDITRKEDYLGINADYVIHLAALIKSSNLDELFNVNVKGMLNVLEFCKQSGAKLIFISSAAVYGDAQSPIKENSCFNPLSSYGLTKMMGEELCEYYHKNFGLDITTLRIFNPYGPGQPEGLLISDIISQLDNERVVLKNPGSKRDYIYIDDVVNSIVQSLNLDSFNVINIGYGKSYSVEELGKMITDKSISFRDNSINKSNIYADITKAKKLLNWKPKVSLEDGLKRTLEARK
jgi:nucleoside-diphosphate-sugar epimerase